MELKVGKINRNIPMSQRQDSQQHFSVDQVELSMHQHYPAKKRKNDGSSLIQSEKKKAIHFRNYELK